MPARNWDVSAEAIELTLIKHRPQEHAGRGLGAEFVVICLCGWKSAQFVISLEAADNGLFENARSAWRTHFLNALRGPGG